MTSNFDFVPDEWGETRADAVRAETYGQTDPRSCVFYARRVVEQVVIRIFDLKRALLTHPWVSFGPGGDCPGNGVTGSDTPTEFGGEGS